jgi:hypothetical protein
MRRASLAFLLTSTPPQVDCLCAALQQQKKEEEEEEELPF